jgi:hypothetical protein
MEDKCEDTSNYFDAGEQQFKADPEPPWSWANSLHSLRITKKGHTRTGQFCRSKLKESRYRPQVDWEEK